MESLSSHQLDAFVAVAKALSFSKAADAIHLTQSAVSQKIQKLEEELGVSLFIRKSGSLELTHWGEKLLRYCSTKLSLESEFLRELKTKSDGKHFGSVRIGGYSSIMRSVIIPCLAPFIRANPGVNFEFCVAEMAELPNLLNTSHVDYIVLDNVWYREQVDTLKLGLEKYVVIESSAHQTPPDLYLDHDVHDRATELFFKEQDGKHKYRRAFCGDVYGILDSVELGMGRAVMSAHLINKAQKLKIVRGFKPVQYDVTLHYFKQPFYSRLHDAVTDVLKKNASQYL